MRPSLDDDDGDGLMGEMETSAGEMLPGQEDDFQDNAPTERTTQTESQDDGSAIFGDDAPPDTSAVAGSPVADDDAVAAPSGPAGSQDRCSAGGIPWRRHRP